MELKTVLSLDACHTELHTETDGWRRREDHGYSNIKSIKEL